MEITYIIQKSRRRSISVSVMTDNRVLVKAPFGTSERTVQEFLLSKKDKWLKDNGGVYMKRASCYNEKKQEE